MSIFGPRSVSSIFAVPATSESFAAPFGFRASKISTTRGRPCVISAPATPPGWNVRIVSWGAGSADGLRGDDPNRVADLGDAARRQEDAVAGLADAELALALEHGPDRQGGALGVLAETVEHLPEKWHRHERALLGQHGLARPARSQRLVHVLGERPARAAPCLAPRGPG